MPENKIILFDGVCNLCNNAVQYIIKRDRKQIFKFASIQSDFGKKLLKHQPDLLNLQTVILVEGDKIYIKSSAFIRIMKTLGGIYKLFQILRVVPAFISNFFYMLISKYRYKIFGKRESCMIPDENTKNRFISL